MLKELTKLIEKECKNAIEYGIFGTQEFHIEKIERIADKDGAFNFLVTTWNDVSFEPRKTKELGLFEIMDLLGRIIGHRALSDSVEVAKNYENRNS